MGNKDKIALNMQKTTTTTKPNQNMINQQNVITCIMYKQLI